MDVMCSIFKYLSIDIIISSCTRVHDIQCLVSITVVLLDNVWDQLGEVLGYLLLGPLQPLELLSFLDTFHVVVQLAAHVHPGRLLATGGRRFVLDTTNNIFSKRSKKVSCALANIAVVEDPYARPFFLRADAPVDFLLAIIDKGVDKGTNFFFGAGVDRVDGGEGVLLSDVFSLSAS